MDSGKVDDRFEENGGEESGEGTMTPEAISSLVRSLLQAPELQFEANLSSDLRSENWHSLVNWKREAKLLITDEERQCVLSSKFDGGAPAKPNHATFFASITQGLLGKQPCLPTDVVVKCASGQEVNFHKIMLLMHSPYIRMAFNKMTPQAKAENDGGETSLDLRQFSANAVGLLKEWIYTGEVPKCYLLCPNLLEMLLLGNYICMPPWFAEACGTAFKALVVEGHIKDEGIVGIYFLAKGIGETKLQDQAFEFFKFFKTLPEELVAIDFRHFVAYLTCLDYLCVSIDASKGERCPKAMLRCVTSCASLPALPRERFLLNLVAKFLRHDKAKRIRDEAKVVELFSQLRLAFVAKEIDFMAMGLDELNDVERYPNLHQLIESCKVDDDFDFYAKENAGKIPGKFYRPRPTSVKYSIWTNIVGTFPTHYNKTKPKKEPSAAAAKKRKSRGGEEEEAAAAAGPSPKRKKPDNDDDELWNLKDEDGNSIFLPLDDAEQPVEQPDRQPEKEGSSNEEREALAQDGEQENAPGSSSGGSKGSEREKGAGKDKYRQEQMESGESSGSGSKGNESEKATEQENGQEQMESGESSGNSKGNESEKATEQENRQEQMESGESSESSKGGERENATEQENRQEQMESGESTGNSKGNESEKATQQENGSEQMESGESSGSSEGNASEKAKGQGSGVGDSSGGSKAHEVEKAAQCQETSGKQDDESDQQMDGNAKTSKEPEEPQPMQVDSAETNDQVEKPNNSEPSRLEAKPLADVEESGDANQEPVASVHQSEQEASNEDNSLAEPEVEIQINNAHEQAQLGESSSTKGEAEKPVEEKVGMPNDESSQQMDGNETEASNDSGQGGSNPDQPLMETENDDQGPKEVEPTQQESAEHLPKGVLLVKGKSNVRILEALLQQVAKGNEAETSNDSGNEGSNLDQSMEFESNGQVDEAQKDRNSNDESGQKLDGNNDETSNDSGNGGSNPDQSMEIETNDQVDEAKEDRNSNGESNQQKDGNDTEVSNDSGNGESNPGQQPMEVEKDRQVPRDAEPAEQEVDKAPSAVELFAAFRKAAERVGEDRLLDIIQQKGEKEGQLALVDFVQRLRDQSGGQPRQEEKFLQGEEPRQHGEPQQPQEEPRQPQDELRQPQDEPSQPQDEPQQPQVEEQPLDQADPRPQEEGAVVAAEEQQQESQEGAAADRNNNDSNNQEPVAGPSGMGAGSAAADAKSKPVPPSRVKSKRFCWVRGQEHRITAVDVFTKKMENSEPFVKEVPWTTPSPGAIVAGLRFHWSDGTTDEAGHLDEEDKKSAVFEEDGHEGVIFDVKSTEDKQLFLESISFETCHPRLRIHIGSSQRSAIPPGYKYNRVQYGVFGRQDNQWRGYGWPFRTLIGNSCSGEWIEHMYLDGLKGVEFTNLDTGAKVIAGLRFKLSVHANDSLEHFMAFKSEPRRRKKKAGGDDPPSSPSPRMMMAARKGYVYPSPPRKPKKEHAAKALTLKHLKKSENVVRVTDLGATESYHVVLNIDKTNNGQYYFPQYTIADDCSRGRGQY